MHTPSLMACCDGCCCSFPQLIIIYNTHIWQLAHMLWETDHKAKKLHHGIADDDDDDRSWRRNVKTASKWALCLAWKWRKKSWLFFSRLNSLLVIFFIIQAKYFFKFIQRRFVEKTIDMWWRIFIFAYLVEVEIAVGSPQIENEKLKSTFESTLIPN